MFIEVLCVIVVIIISGHGNLHRCFGVMRNLYIGGTCSTVFGVLIWFMQVKHADLRQ